MRVGTKTLRDKARKPRDKLRIMLPVLVCSPFFLSKTSKLSDINWVLAKRVTGTIGSVASGLVGNKEAQGRFLQV